MLNSSILFPSFLSYYFFSICIYIQVYGKYVYNVLTIRVKYIVLVYLNIIATTSFIAPSSLTDRWTFVLTIRASLSIDDFLESAQRIKRRGIAYVINQRTLCEMADRMWCRLTRNRFITDINFALRFFSSSIRRSDSAREGMKITLISFSNVFKSHCHTILQSKFSLILYNEF